MTGNEIDLVQKAFESALESGAPGLSDIMRAAIVANAIRRIARQLNGPWPAITPHDGKGE